MPSGRFTRALPLVGGALAPFLLCLALGGCTTQAPVPQPDPSTPTGGASLDSGMTAVPEQVTCFVEKDLSTGPPLQPGELWPGAAEVRAAASRITRHDAAGCHPTATPPTTCDGVTFPWVFAQDREIYSWTGARTVVSGLAAARLAAGSDLSKGNVALEYVLLRFDPGDPARGATGALLADLVRRCGGGRPGTLGAVKGIVATQKSIFGAGDDRGRGVLVSGADDLLWLMVDGAAWSTDSERRALGLAAQRLRAG
ncbi:hypothetical protein [Terrabacter sp. 2RAF25]|uniref:hypothetical protein n=1 Tax=Terrabacter sp. 2RAF25 TaxID=3232998 RepID=UPI003F95D17B